MKAKEGHCHLLSFRKLGVGEAQILLPIGSETVELSLDNLRAAAEVDGEGNGRATADVDRSVLRRAERELDLGAFAGQFHFSGTAFGVTAAELKGGAVTAQLVGIEGNADDHSFVIALPLSALSILGDWGDRFYGSIKAGGELQGQLANPDVAADAEWTEAQIDDYVVGDIDLELVKREDRLNFRDVVVTASSGIVRGNAELYLKPPLPLTGTFQSDEVDLDGLFQTLNIALETGTRAAARGNIEGELSPLNLEISGGGEVEGKPAVGGAGAILFDASIADDASQIKLHLNQSQRSSVQAVLAFGDAPLSGDVQAETTDLKALLAIAPSLLGDLEIGGILDAQLQIGNQIEARFAGRELRFQELEIDSLAGMLQYRDGLLELYQAALRGPVGLVSANGTFALDDKAPNDWKLKFQDFEPRLITEVLRQYWDIDVPLDGGRLSGVIDASGGWSKLRGSGDLVLRDPVVVERPLARIDLAGGFELPDWRGNLSIAFQPKGVLRLIGSGRGDDIESLDISSQPILITSLTASADVAPQSSVSARGALAGNITSLEGEVFLEGRKLRYGDTQIEDVDVALRAQAGSWLAQSKLLQEKLHLDATLSLAGNQPYELHLRADDSDLGRLLGLPKASQLRLGGEADIRGCLGKECFPEGTAQLRLKALQGDFLVEIADTVEILSDRNGFRASPFTIRSASQELLVRAEASFDGSAKMNLVGGLDLRALELATASIDLAEGKVEVDAQLLRSASGAWQVMGQGKGRDLALELGLPFALRDGQIGFSLADHHVAIQSLSAEIGGGRLTGKGIVDLQNGPEVDWRLQGISLSTEEGIEAELSGRGEFSGGWEKLLLEGDIVIDRALYDREVALTDLLPTLRRRVKSVESAALSPARVELDLRIRADDQLFVDNSYLRAELWTKLRVRGAPQRPRLSGTVGVHEGQAQVGDRKFTIVSGSVDFTDTTDIDPTLNIAAESEVRTSSDDYFVTAVISGSASNPRVEFTTDDPGLSQNDIVTLVATGRRPEELGGKGSAVSAADVASLLPTGYIEDEATSLFGVDRFEVEAVQTTTGNIQPQVSIGKNLREELRASLSIGFGVEPSTTMQLDYDLTRSITLYGSWESETEQEAGAVGGGVNFLHRFRKFRFPFLDDGKQDGDGQ